MRTPAVQVEQAPKGSEKIRFVLKQIRFEGMKAYRHEDGSVWTFRPEKNAARFNRSAKRLALPEIDENDFVESLKALVKADESWVPAFDAGEASLYLRPFMFASEAFLGVRAARALRVLRVLTGGPPGAHPRHEAGALVAVGADLLALTLIVPRR